MDVRSSCSTFIIYLVLVLLEFSQKFYSGLSLPGRVTLGKSLFSQPQFLDCVQTDHSNIQMEIQVVKNKRKCMILTPKRGEKSQKNKKEVDEEKPNCNYPSILVNIGTHPTVLCWFLPRSMPHSAAVNFSSLRFLCRCIINFLSSCGKFKREKKTPPSQVFYFPKKSPKLFIPKIPPGLTFSLTEKNEHTFSLWIRGSPFPIILWGREGADVLLFMDVRTHQPLKV